MTLFLTSDTHFGHANMLLHSPSRAAMFVDPATLSLISAVRALPRDEARAVLGSDEVRRALSDATKRMDAEMIDRWNARVGRKDHVIHLGDFAFKATPGDIERIFFSLNGAKSLVIGNHDNAATLALPWAEFARHSGDRVDASPAESYLLKAADEVIFLSHYSHRSWEGMNSGVLHAYGHSHDNLPTWGGSMDVGVDVPFMDFGPRAVEEIVPELVRLREEAYALEARLAEDAAAFGLAVEFPDGVPTFYRKDAAGGRHFVGNFASCREGAAFLDGILAAQEFKLGMDVADEDTPTTPSLTF